MAGKGEGEGCCGCLRCVVKRERLIWSIMRLERSACSVKHTLLPLRDVLHRVCVCVLPLRDVLHRLLLLWWCDKRGVCRRDAPVQRQQLDCWLLLGVVVVPRVDVTGVLAVQPAFFLLLLWQVFDLL